MWKTVLFDLDGTLTDSGEGIMKSAAYALDRGFNIRVEDVNELRFFVGPPLIPSFMKFELTEEEARIAVNLYRERYNTTGVWENQIYDGMVDLIKRLKREGMTLALASSKPTVYCKQILESYHLTEYFDVIVGSNLDGTMTDKKEVIEEVIRQLEGEPSRSEVVMVGDRSYDMIGAKKAGISSIGVSYGYGDREELEETWPDCIVDSVGELKNVLIGQYRDGKSQKDLSGVREEVDAQDSYSTLPTEGRSISRVHSAGIGENKLYPFDGNSFHRVIRITWPLVMAVAINFAMSFLGVFLMMLFYGNSAITDQDVMMQQTMWLTAIMDIIIFAFMYYQYRTDEALRKRYGATERLLKPHSFELKDVIFMLCSVEMVSFLSSSISSLLIPVSEGYEALMDSMNAIPPLLSFVLVAFLAPLAEEVLFRGVIYRRARDYYNVYVAALISGILFAVFHMNLSQGVPAFFVGVAFCLLYEHYGTLKANILCHVLINIFGSITILTENTVILTIVGLIMFMMMVFGFYSTYYIYKKDTRVNKL